MEFLAIRNGEGKGVYVCNDKEERRKYLNMYPGSSCTIFKDTEKEKALKWAGVNEVSNRKQKVVEVNSGKKNKQEKQKTDKHQFLEMIDYYLENGFDYVCVKTDDGSTVWFWIRDLAYISSASYIRDVSDYSSGALRCNYISYYKNYCTTQLIPFDVFADFLQKETDSFVEGRKIVKDEAFLVHFYSELINSMMRNRRIDFYFKKKSSIEMLGDMAIIDYSYENINSAKTTTSESATKELYVDEWEKRFVAINVNHVVSVIPYKTPFKIEDDLFLKAIKEVKKQ